MKYLLSIALFVTLSGSALADMPDTPFFREVVRERQHVRSDAPMPVCGILTCICPAGWSYVANPGHCEVHTPSEAHEATPAPSIRSISGVLTFQNDHFGTLVTISDAGIVDFNWPAIEKCSAADPAKPDTNYHSVTDCKIWLAARSAATPNRYTLGDIDRMRAYVTQILGPICRRTPSDAQIEDRLRTDMAAGITPDELEERAK